MIRKLSLALVALFVLPLVASADFVSSLDTSGLQNKVTFQTYYAVYRGNTVVNPGSYQADDILMTLYRATDLQVQDSVNSSSFTSVWSPTSNVDQAYGYSAAKIRPGGALSPAPSDPAGQLGGAFFGLYASTTNWSVGSASAIADVNATLSGANDLAFVTNGGGADYGILMATVGVAPATKFFAQSQVLPIGTQDLTLATDAISGSDLVGGGFVAGAPFLPGIGEWYAGGLETVSFALVPEPGTIALWGSCLAIGAVVALRRRKQS